MNFTDVYKVMLMIFYDVYNVLVIGELCCGYVINLSSYSNHVYWIPKILIMYDLS